MTMVTPLEPLSTAATGKPVLLIVDDEAGPREALRFVFKDRFNCVTTTGGRQGIEYAKSNPIDIAILDIRCRTCQAWMSCAN